MSRCNIKDNNGDTGLCIACQKGHIDIVKLLSDK
jgi:ankyrin repeat protein